MSLAKHSKINLICRKTFELIKFTREEICDYIFPKYCFGCRQEGEYLCSACFNKIEFLNNFSCFLCHRPDQARGLCSDCANSSEIDQIIIATVYTDNFVGRLVEGLKYDFVVDLAAPLARIIVSQIETIGFSEIIRQSLIVPIPLHRKRLLERGFNQSIELAKLLAMKYDCEVNERLLIRVKDTAQQAKLSRDERLENIKNAFVFNQAEKTPETVILFDDVLTTGATFVAAAKCLKANGVKKIVCLAICHG